MKEITKAFALHVTFWKRESTNIIYGERCNLERERENLEIHIISKEEVNGDTTYMIP